MVTDAQIFSFLSKKNPNATNKDIEAFRKFAKAFECEDCESPAEIHEKVLASMRDLSDRISLATSESERARIILSSGLVRIAGIEPLELS